MKRILSLLSVSAVLVCCSDLTTDEILSGGGDDTVPSTPVEPGTNEDELLPLVLNFGTSAMTKALVEDTVLPTGSSVGITIRDDYGRYTGDDYTNIRYSSVLSAGVQVWETTSPVLLARETGTLFSYWPHSEDEVDGKTITIAATSDIQTDYMWGLPVAVSKSNRTASIAMQHALSAVRIYCKRGSYTGAGEITGVAFGGDCAATAGTLDLTCGALDDLSGQGTMIAPAITSKTITSSYQKVSDIIVVPTSGTNGKVVVTLDGTDYPIEFNTLDLNPGEMSEFYLTANDGELSAADIMVGDWTYGDPEGDEIVVSNKVKITGDISNIAFNNTVSEDGTVTIKAMPTSGEKSFTEVEPVTYTGTATLTQSSDIDTGVRTITISDITTDVEVIFAGTIEYHVILKVNSEQGVACDMFGANVTPLWEQRQTLSRMDWNDERILGKIVETGKYSTKYKQYTFSTSGTQTVKCLFRNNVITNNIFQSCDYYYARIGGKTQTVDYSAFMTCDLKELYLSEGIETIGSQAFYGNAITTLRLPGTLSSFEGSIVNDCPYLTSIILPQTIQKIGKLFGTCQRLTYIACKSESAPTLEAEGIFTNLPDNGVLVVPEGANYSTWMSSENLGGKNWTIVYMSE